MVSRTAILDFQRADFNIFRRLVGRVACEAALKEKESRKAGLSSRRSS